MNNFQKTIAIIGAAVLYEGIDVAVQSMEYNYSNNLWLEALPKVIGTVGGPVLGYNLIKESRVMGALLGYLCGSIIGDAGSAAIKFMDHEHIKPKQEKVYSVKQENNVDQGIEDYYQSHLKLN